MAIKERLKKVEQKLKRAKKRLELARKKAEMCYTWRYLEQGRYERNLLLPDGTIKSVLDDDKISKKLKRRKKIIR